VERGILIVVSVRGDVGVGHGARPLMVVVFSEDVVDLIALFLARFFSCLAVTDGGFVSAPWSAIWVGIVRQLFVVGVWVSWS